MPKDILVRKYLSELRWTRDPIGRLRRWKIALSLAVAGALAAPFAFGTYEAQPTYSVWVPLTAQEKERLAIDLRSNGCEDLNNSGMRVICSVGGWEGFKRGTEEELERGGNEEFHADLPDYWMMNVRVAAATAASLFGLTFLIPMLIRGIAFLARRYWRWLNA
jgi:hypothetical protein